MQLSVTSSYIQKWISPGLLAILARFARDKIINSLRENNANASSVQSLKLADLKSAADEPPRKSRKEKLN